MKRRSTANRKRAVPPVSRPAYDPTAACRTGAFRYWLSLEQIRKMQRMRRQTVAQAMETGELPYERRGRIRYARLADVLAWEERRLGHPYTVSTRPIDPDLADLAG